MLCYWKDKAEMCIKKTKVTQYARELELNYYQVFRNSIWMRNQDFCYQNEERQVQRVKIY